MRVLSAISFLLFSMSVKAEIKAHYDYKKLKIKSGVELITDKTYDTESIGVNFDGTEICWLGKKSSSDLVYPTDIFRLNLDSRELIKVPKRGRILNIFSKCGYDLGGNIVISELFHKPGAIIKTLKTKKLYGEYDPTGYNSKVVKFVDKKRETVFDPKDLGHKSKEEFLKHPKISPDGRWMTYYIVGKHEESKGVYLYNLETKVNTKLSINNTYDKHPTWTPDGKKILFHFQKNAKGKKPEMAYLGYFNVELDGNRLLNSKRVLIDNVNSKKYIYHKHPAVYAGSNLVFFHGEKELDGKKQVFVRKLDGTGKVYRLKIEVKDIELKKAKHPATAYNRSGMFFVGELEDGEKYNIYKLTDSQIIDIESKLNE